MFTLNHPSDCTKVPILLCSTRVNKFQGTGSRLFFLGRCLAEGLNSARTLVLTNDLPSTLDMLKPFEPWSNCTLHDTLINRGKNRIRLYYPMDSKSLVKSPDIPSVGALYPKQFAKNGYWWWKAQEISYALRPTVETTEAFWSNIYRSGINSSKTAVFQVRRTDKTEGCLKTYGNYYELHAKNTNS